MGSNPSRPPEILADQRYCVIPQLGLWGTIAAPLPPASRTRCKTVGPTPGTESILRRSLLDVIDHQQVNRSLLGFQLEAELFL